MAPPEGTIRLGLIGCGRVAWERHLPALRHVAGIRLAAVADTDRERAAALARAAPACTVAADYRALLARGDIDAVGVLTPTATHAQIGCAALEAGKHLLIEKPLALSVEECESLIARAAATPKIVVVGFNLRWHRLVRRARAWIAAGRLGALRGVRSTYTHFRDGTQAPDWHRRLALGGGVSFNEAVHHFDLWRYLLGCEIEELASFHRASEHFEDETHATTARLSAGVVGTGFFSFTTAPDSEVEVYGEAGRLALSCYRFDGLRFFPHSRYPGDLTMRARNLLAALPETGRFLTAARRGGDFQATFVGLWNHFAACIRAGQPSECRLVDGARALQAALAARDSARGGHPVRIEPLRAGQVEAHAVSGDTAGETRERD